ncbi:hypothetical protein Tco_1014192 [Tanacetum coccineum]
MLLAKKDSVEQVLLAEDQAWMESSRESSSFAEETIAEGISDVSHHSNDALEIENFKRRAREKYFKIEFAYDMEIECKLCE